MKEITLTHGLVALVDDEDFEWLSQWKWTAQTYPNRQQIYAVRHAKLETDNWGKIRMHRLILNAPPNMQVDHINFDGLDNRRSNLRLCSLSENARWTKKNSNNTSGYKGVVLHKRDQKWYANIRYQGHTIHLGVFQSPELAALAYNEAAVKLFGDFAYLNKVSIKAALSWPGNEAVEAAFELLAAETAESAQ